MCLSTPASHLLWYNCQPNHYKPNFSPECMLCATRTPLKEMEYEKEIMMYKNGRKCNRLGDE